MAIPNGDERREGKTIGEYIEDEGGVCQCGCC